MASSPTVVVPRAADAFVALQQSDCICSRALAAGAAETITVPDAATHVNFAASDNFVANMTTQAAPVAAAWPTDKDDGSQPGELNPTFRRLNVGQNRAISVIANSVTVLTASFYKIAAPGA